MAGPKLEARLGLDTKEFDKNLDGAEGGVKSFGKEIVALGGFMAAASAAAAIMVDWFKKTEMGADYMNDALVVSKRLLNDIMLGQQFDLKKSLEIAEKENEIRSGNRKDLMMEAKIRAEIRGYRLDAISDEKSLAEKIEAARKAKEKQQELERYIKKDLQEELLVVQERLKTEIGNTDLLERQAQLVAAIYNADNSESLRDTQRLNGLLNEQKQRAEDLVDAFTDVAAAVEEIERVKGPEAIGGISGSFTDAYNNQQGGGTIGELVGTNNKGGATGAINEMTQALMMQQEAVSILAGGFYDLFTGAEDGFKNMVESVLQGIARVVAELAAKAAILGLITLIFPGTALAGTALNGLKGMFTGFTGGGGMNMGSIGSTMGTQKLVAAVKGDQLQLILDRQ